MAHGGDVLLTRCAAFVRQADATAGQRRERGVKRRPWPTGRPDRAMEQRPAHGGEWNEGWQRGEPGRVVELQTTSRGRGGQREVWRA